MLAKLSGLVSEETTQYAVFIGLSVFAFVLTAIAHGMDSSWFQKYFGRIHPYAAVLIMFILGLALLSALLLDGKFAIYRSGDYKGLLVAVGLTLPFAAVILLVDRLAPFPENINVPFPGSLLFYPAIAYVVEILFHILPFCLVYFILRFMTGGEGSPGVIWASILIVSLLEPVFQVIASGHDTPWVSVYLALHLFTFNLVQLLLFKRYDFLTMYAFRFSYYILWHILWGHLRLGLLF